MKIFLFILAVFVIFTFFGCEESYQISQVEREDLFYLNIGVLEDQIALFNLLGSRGLNSTDIAMRDGFFYISDSNGAKILRFNSFGDLLFMIYNEETNPPPLTLSPYTEGSMLTRWAIPHPLIEPGSIAINSRNFIYVHDLLSPDRHGYDVDSSFLLDSTILQFDAEGRFLNEIGREGIGGSPFPRIEGLYTNLNDDLAVVCRHISGWSIYWYDSGGNFLYYIQLDRDSIPIPQGRDDLMPSLDKIIAGPDSRNLYVKVDYYRHIFDESTNTRMGIEPDVSIVWIMNSEEGVWERQIEVPFFELSYTEQNRRISSRMIYSLLGIMSNERLFFSFPVDGGYSILVLSSDSGQSIMQHQGIIRVSNEELHFNAFDLSHDGILSGLLAGDFQVKLVWWRTDRLLGEFNAGR